MNELRQAIATIIDLASQVIDELDDETMLALADLLNAASERLARMEEEEGNVEGLQQEPPLEPGMESSNVNSFGYDPESERLLVKFNGKENRDDGPVYGYGGVPANIFEIFRKGAIPAKTDGQNKWGSWWKGKYPSLGAAMYHLIRAGGYPYQKLS